MHDPYRPRYHLTTPPGWGDPFDPNGALYWNGRYHLMYIFQDDQGHSWGHVSSADLVHWQQHPHPLRPGGADKGIFSGGAFVDAHGVPTISYWGIDFENNQVGICLATSTNPHLDHWTKHPANPVVRETDFGITVAADGRIHGASDPSAIWRHNGRYYMLTGNLQTLKKHGLHENRVEFQGDTAFLLGSDDLVRWEYLHPFYQSDRRWTAADEDCMCPEFFPLGDRHMLLFISHNHGCQYYLGRYENDRFVPESHGRMSWKDRFFFAPESLRDDKGRRIMWAWIFDGRQHDVKKLRGWTGTMSLPRVLWLGEDRSLRLAPPEELTALRRNPRQAGPLTIPAGADHILAHIRGASLELQIELSSATATAYGVKVRCSPDGAEQTAIFYDAIAKQLTIDTRDSSRGNEAVKTVEAGPLELAPGEPLRLRVFVDQSVMEVFANDRQAVVRHVYPIHPESIGVALFSHGGPATARLVEAWDMAPLELV